MTTIFVSFMTSSPFKTTIVLSLWLCVSSDGETSVPVCQCWGTVAPTEQAAANDCVALPHSLLLQVRHHLLGFLPVQCFYLIFNFKHLSGNDSSGTIFHHQSSIGHIKNLIWWWCSIFFLYNVTEYFQHYLRFCWYLCTDNGSNLNLCQHRKPLRRPNSSLWLYCILLSCIIVSTILIVYYFNLHFCVPQQIELKE